MTRRLESAIEFSRLYGNEECRAFAETHSRFYDFWKHCQRSIWMLDLLESTNYRNYMGLWALFEVITEQQKRHEGETDLEGWREHLHKKIKERVDAHTEDEEKGYAIPGYARFAEWCSAYVWTGYVMQEAMRTAMFHAGFDASVELALEGKGKQEREEAWNKAREAAFLDESAKQSNLLRDTLGNPFDCSHGQDFD